MITALFLEEAQALFTLTLPLLGKAVKNPPSIGAEMKKAFQRNQANP